MENYCTLCYNGKIKFRSDFDLCEANMNSHRKLFNLNLFNHALSRTVGRESNISFE